MRRASRGWEDWRATDGEFELEVGVVVRARRDRRVSWRPGAEGAEFSGRVWGAWAEGGMKRRDWKVLVVVFVWDRRWGWIVGGRWVVVWVVDG